MNKSVVAFITLVSMTVSAYSQAPKCKLTEADAPIVRGLRLGMSTQQLLALFPGASKRKEMKNALAILEKVKATTDSEPVYLAFDPSTDAASTENQFAGVESVSAGIYQGRVIDLNITYVGVSWTIDEWLAKVSETLGLPGGQDWVAGTSENPSKVLKCAGIEIEAATQGGSASIRIRTTEYLKGTGERRSAAEEKKRREFKP